ncbi:CRISPR-associated endonuclease/helicase Cas3 [Desulfuromonas thiophila]|uniref:CRISPR-associated endonuclease/helicase Cas3 n=1 Tax=Desulfuromonas thiophila TaxID=57664 RepID=A0A1G6XZJ5_9BACT|nr:CRISPR-associated endonuclease/helicase Cas3 [Desulfuromonas thiophila]
MPKVPDDKINHAYVSQIVLSEILIDLGWPEELALKAADAVGCHHGERASEHDKDKAEHEIYVGRGEYPETVRKHWSEARRKIFEALMTVIGPSDVPEKQDMSGPEFMLLSGLTSFADWIGSNDTWFHFGAPEDCDDLSGWFEKRKACAEQALDAIGWNPRTPLSPEQQTFEQVFSFGDPRPLQRAVADALPTLQGPSVLLVEAPMGEGKTEAAFYAHLEMQRRFGHRGLYVALPTKATGNAMFKRLLKFVQDQKGDRRIDLQLIHGAALLNDTYQNLRFNDIRDPDDNGEIRAGEWFTNKKRALLSEYGVGTVDQAIVPILPVKHNFVRLWGLANRVVVFDEIHAYDAYTGTLLIQLIHWLLELGSSVVLLSATLPPRFRRQLADAIHAHLPDKDEPYPRLSIFTTHQQIRQLHFEADANRRQTVQLRGISPELPCIKAALEEHLAKGGMGLALVNTVQRAQELYQQFPKGKTICRDGEHVGKRLDDGTEVYLFHARFPANKRQQREDQALAVFGEKGDRSGRKILIATQVVEQSLDLDFDLIITDLAPIDLLLQRAGRLWRHKRDNSERGGITSPLIVVASLMGDEPPSFGKPLWWGGELYREDLLLATWVLLRKDGRTTITLPDEIDVLVEAVYEEKVVVPEALLARLNKALPQGEGADICKRGQANQAIIGLPDDDSWNDPSRFVLYDEDTSGVHRTLMAQTRLGKDSVIAIPLFSEDSFDQGETPDFTKAKQWFMRSVSLSRKNVVIQLKSEAVGVPKGWEKSSLLRNCYPLMLNEEKRWVVNEQVRLDDELGVVYERKGDE